jgi:hypothetical protein
MPPCWYSVEGNVATEYGDLTSELRWLTQVSAHCTSSRWASGLC